MSVGRGGTQVDALLRFGKMALLATIPGRFDLRTPSIDA